VDVLKKYRVERIEQLSFLILFSVLIGGCFWLNDRGAFPTAVYLSLLLAIIAGVFNSTWSKIAIMIKSISFVAFLGLLLLAVFHPRAQVGYERAFVILLFVGCLSYWVTERSEYMVAAARAGSIITAVLLIPVLAESSEMSRLQLPEKGYNPLMLSYCLGVAFVVALDWALLSSGKCRFFAGLVSLLLLTGVLATYSRSAVIAILILLLLAPVLYFENHKQKFIAAVVILCCLASAVGWLSDGVDAVFRGDNYRVGIWTSAIHHFSKVWVLGYGPEFDLIFSSNSRTFSNPHNQYLRWLLSLGAVGLILVLMVVLPGVRSLMKLRRDPSVNIVWLCLVFSAVTSGFGGLSVWGRPHEIWLIVWMPIALLIGLELRLRSANVRSESK